LQVMVLCRKQGTVGGKGGWIITSKSRVKFKA
jgi:hypothetical protein